VSFSSSILTGVYLEKWMKKELMSCQFCYKVIENYEF
jgi:hypothetical protein